MVRPDDIVTWAGGPIAVVDCYGMLSDDTIRRYFGLGGEVKGLGRGHLTSASRTKCAAGPEDLATSFPGLP